MDDTTRRVGRGDEFAGRGDEVRGRSEEQLRDYASTAPAPTVRSTGNTGTDDLDPDSSRRARQIESEIAHTRAEMSETIEAIQERLRPANLVSDATEKVKAATTEKVKVMAETASETAQDMMRGTRDRAYDMVEGARQNPIPALMIGAGVAWLLMDRSRKAEQKHAGRTEWSQYSPRSYAGRDDFYRSTEPDYSDVDDKQSSYRQAGEGRHYGYERETEWATGTARTLQDARESARQTVRRTQNQLQRMLHDNPLLVGAAAVLAGAAIGASLPETERENQLMGETRDSVIDRAQEAARDAASTVREVAGEAVEKVTDKVAPTKP